MLIGDPLSEGSSASSTNPVTYHRALGSGELIVQSERNLDVQQGAACS